ncbi:MAG TPA: VOC family protein [Acidimicrobiales bacterium]|nr:VOC family protein [Acidimicrobiales bacterium]HWI05516.1 VOC family protein [Acidimicrobiales bacterium]
MGERERYEPGTFCWADLGTDDPGAARAFYVALFGWATEDVPMGAGGPYTMCRLGDGIVCAIYRRQEGQGPPAWLSYVSVADADAAVTAARAAGAPAQQDPVDVFDAGRMAVVQDPTGAHFAVWQPGSMIGATLVNVPGALCLNQLNTSDPAGAADFYTEVFGWRIEQVATDPMPYWGIWNGPGLNGGMMALPPGSPAPPHWLVYFASDDVDATSKRTGELGGQVVLPPTPVPGGRIAVATDPTGATFAFLDGRLDP